MWYLHQVIVQNQKLKMFNSSLIAITLYIMASLVSSSIIGCYHIYAGKMVKKKASVGINTCMQYFLHRVSFEHGFQKKVTNFIFRKMFSWGSIECNFCSYVTISRKCYFTITKLSSESLASCTVK